MKVLSVNFVIKNFKEEKILIVEIVLIVIIVLIVLNIVINVLINNKNNKWFNKIFNINFMIKLIRLNNILKMKTILYKM